MFGEFEEQLALDSCVIIEIFRNKKIVKKILRFFKGKQTEIAIQDIVILEVQKIIKIPKNKILEKLSQLLLKRTFFFTTSEEIKKAAKKIEGKYGICHYPDSTILAASKLNSWMVLTLDKNMLRTAGFEGTVAIDPCH